VSTARDQVWCEQMRAAIAGDEAAYGKLLAALVPLIRSACRGGFARFGTPGNDVEDVVQETLLAIHLKRHTWQETQPLTPWVLAIARNKLIDQLRRGGRAVKVPIDDVIDTLPADIPEERLDGQEVAAMLDALPERQRQIVKAITLDGVAIKDVAARLDMKEGAVRVALHRSLKAMAAVYRSKLS
jgi:RNA polymerase sigma-70 factor (ECF subfamily)